MTEQTRTARRAWSRELRDQLLGDHPQVHARTLGSGKNRGPYQRGVQTFCMKPWKYMDGPSGQARPEGLRRVDFLDFTSRITCDTCLRAIDQAICGGAPKREETLELTRSIGRAVELELEVT